MSKTRSSDEIMEARNLLVELLEVMPRFSTFGDDNHKLINDELAVLRGHWIEIHGDLNQVDEWRKGISDEWLQDRKDDLKNFSK